jgi:hypothetical protein
MTNKRFSTYLENPDRLEFLEMCYDLGEFLTYIMLNVIFHALHDYFVYLENMYICNSHNLYLLHMNSSILRKCCVEYVNKMRLVKVCMQNTDKIICIV